MDPQQENSFHAKPHGAPIALALPKTPSGILGLDEITGGGLPRGRSTLVCGGAGSGKTLVGMEFLVRGATQYGEPGVFIAFEETAEELTANVRSLGFDLDDLGEQKKLVLDYVHVERGEFEEAGPYDLEGLFIRAAHAISSIGAKRVVLDTLEVLFAGLSDEGALRSELRRLFRWLKEKGVTSIITAERGDGSLTRRGLEEYVSDCVIFLDNRVVDEVATRRIRVVKYRGATHGINEYPFLIDECGVDVLPISSASLEYTAPTDHVSTGVERIDTMLGGEGYYRGSTVLISGTAGTGKTSLAAAFVESACARGERAVYFAFEESQNQVVRNMRSIGVDLAPWVENGLLRFHAIRPTLFGLENHLAAIHKRIRDFDPKIVVVDPISNLACVASQSDVKRMLTRLVDYLKIRQITCLFTCLSHRGEGLEPTDIGISSVVDTWLLIRSIELDGERNRGLSILKSRGMAHSNQIRELVLGPDGFHLTDVYLGPGGVLTGSARLVQEAKELAAGKIQAHEVERRRREVAQKRQEMEARIEAMRAEYEAEEDELNRFIVSDQESGTQRLQYREVMARSRKADVEGTQNQSGAVKW
jgi:circadian clock protein KaiC